MSGDGPLYIDSVGLLRYDGRLVSTFLLGNEAARDQLDRARRCAEAETNLLLCSLALSSMEDERDDARAERDAALAKVERLRVELFNATTMHLLWHGTASKRKERNDALRAELAAERIVSSENLHDASEQIQQLQFQVAELAARPDPTEPPTLFCAGEASDDCDVRGPKDGWVFRVNQENDDSLQPYCPNCDAWWLAEEAAVKAAADHAPAPDSVTITVSRSQAEEACCIGDVILTRDQTDALRAALDADQ